VQSIYVTLINMVVPQHSIYLITITMNESSFPMLKM